MAFMRPEIFKCDYWRVETTHGTEIVPQEVEGDPARLADYVEGKIRNVEEDVFAEHGWLGRLSAPGFMDCTEYVTGETRAEVESALADMYDLCDSCLEHEEECTCEVES